MTLASEALAQSTFFNSDVERLKKKLEEQKRQRALVLQGIHQAIREKHTRIVAKPKWAPEVSEAAGTKRTAVKAGALQAVGKGKARGQAVGKGKVAPPVKKKPRLRGTVADWTGLGQNCL